MLGQLTRPQPVGRLVAKMVAVVLALTVVGEVGHQVLSRMGAGVTTIHHAFHIIYPLAAVVVFGVYMVEFIRRDGWPVFSWKLNP